MMRRFSMPLIALLCAALCLTFVPASAQADPEPQFSADVMAKIGKKPSHVCGTASASEGRARLDVETRHAGRFFLVVDAHQKSMRVASERLKAYVDIPVSGDPRNWRDLLKSAAAVVAPQSLGMINVTETARKKKGKTTLHGYAAQRSVSVFDVVFMGKTRRFEVEVWENPFFAPFPMQAACAETKETWPGKAWLTRVTADARDDGYYEVPEGYTRYASVMELVLYALANF